MFLEGFRVYIFCVHIFYFRENRVTFTKHELDEAFQWQGQLKPDCLGDVLEELVKAGKASPTDSLKARLESEVKKDRSWSGIFVNSAKSIGGSLLEKVWNRSLEGRELSLESGLEDIGNAVMASNLSSKSEGTVMTLPDFKKDVINHFQLQPKDLELVVLKLHVLGKIQTRQVNNISYLKLSSAQLDDCDITLYQLRQLEKDLEKQIVGYEDKIKESRLQVKEALASGSRVKAKFLLKKQKRMEQALEKVFGISDNIDVIKTKLETARDEAKVMAAYQAALASLKDAVGSTSVDDIDDLLLDIRDNVEALGDVSDALAGGTVSDDADDLLDTELEKLLSEDTDKLVNQLDDLVVSTDTVTNDTDGASTTSKVLVPS